MNSQDVEIIVLRGIYAVVMGIHTYIHACTHHLRFCLVGCISTYYWDAASRAPNMFSNSCFKSDSNAASQSAVKMIVGWDAVFQDQHGSGFFLSVLTQACTLPTPLPLLTWAELFPMHSIPTIPTPLPWASLALGAIIPAFQWRIPTLWLVILALRLATLSSNQTVSHFIPPSINVGERKENIVHDIVSKTSVVNELGHAGQLRIPSKHSRQ